MQSMEGVAATAGNDKAALTAVCSVVRLGCDVLFSLNVHGLSLHMADLAESWMKIWKLWLDFHNDVLNETDPERESAECDPPLRTRECLYSFLPAVPYIMPTWVRLVLHTPRRNSTSSGHCAAHGQIYRAMAGW